MRLRGINRLRRVAQKLRNQFLLSKALILVYHRVNEVVSDPQLLCVSPKHFVEHLQVLRKDYRPMLLQHLAQTFQDGEIPPQTVAVTFDDGYFDNLYSAKPLLERYDVPATVFVTTGYIGEQHEFWWDELDRLLLQPGELPERLELNVNGRNFRWELGSAVHYTQDVYQCHKGWNILDGYDPCPRQYLYRTLSALLASLPGKEMRKALDDLSLWADKAPTGRQTHRTLSTEEVSQLDTGDLLEVGAHTVSHPVLSTLPADDQRSEIEQSRKRLEDIVGHPVSTFAYPYGSRSDYSAETVTLVREARFACACSNFADVVWRGSDRFQLPRILVRNWDGDEFAARLRGWLGG